MYLTCCSWLTGHIIVGHVEGAHSLGPRHDRQPLVVQRCCTEEERARARVSRSHNSNRSDGGCTVGQGSAYMPRKDASDRYGKGAPQAISPTLPTGHCCDPTQHPLPLKCSSGTNTTLHTSQCCDPTQHPLPVRCSTGTNMILAIYPTLHTDQSRCTSTASHLHYQNAVADSLTPKAPS